MDTVFHTAYATFYSGYAVFLVWYRYGPGKRVPCDCRAIMQCMQGTVFRYTWVFILKTIQWHIHAGSWSLVNCLVGSPYKALYKVLMNIN